MSRPPSEAVIEAVEQALMSHVLCDCLPDSATWAQTRSHLHVEVARAAETAALKTAAERMDDLSRGTPIAAGGAMRAAAKRLDHWADELTDTNDRSK